jgi:hypothetical protein
MFVTVDMSRLTVAAPVNKMEQILRICSDMGCVLIEEYGNFEDGIGVGQAIDSENANSVSSLLTKVRVANAHYSPNNVKGPKAASEVQKLINSGFEKIVDFAYLNNIELVIGISPMHSRLLEVISVSDLWDEFEDWKKRLSKILDSQSKQHLKPNFLLFDFADYNKFTTEEAPSRKNHREMKWFIESSHFNYKLGSLVIQRMSNKSIKTTEFGNIIDVNNIDKIGRAHV